MRRTVLALAVTTLVVAGWPTTQALAQEAARRAARSRRAAPAVTVKVRDQEMKFGVDVKTVVEAKGAGTRAPGRSRGQSRPEAERGGETGDAVEVTYVDAAGGRSAPRIRAFPASGTPAMPSRADDLERHRPESGGERPLDLRLERRWRDVHPGVRDRSDHEGRCERRRHRRRGHRRQDHPDPGRRRRRQGERCRLTTSAARRTRRKSRPHEGDGAET